MMARCVTCCGPTPKVGVQECILDHRAHLVSANNALTRDTEIEGWGLSPRGAGYLFGGDVVEKVRAVLLPCPIRGASRL